ncbi:MAG: hypothetical protein ISS93_03845, partial [Candidatus Aenigmarchaeota archaeon]|nr:hypothetical protein [Candidatus Aenigmarchaeota archaeon]
MDNGYKKYSEPFPILEESCHMIRYYSVDNLNNVEETKQQCIFVDKTPPVTTKTYGKLLVEKEGAKWISTSTEINLSAKDGEPHPSGVKETRWSVSLLEGESPCMDVKLCEASEGTGKWSSSPGPASFTIPEDSCHLIEYYSIDNVNKTENITKQCVFVDDKAPVTAKWVGDPKSKWDGKNATFYTELEGRCWNGKNDSVDCWKITLLTPVAMVCEDPEPHPVGIDEVCFKVDLDKRNATHRYCEEHDGEVGSDGYCCFTELMDNAFFLEESEHNFSFYCVDGLRNKGNVDTEYFKVEGTAFEIPLRTKWNLISVPFTLFDDSPEHVFNQTEYVKSVTTYDSEKDEWYIYSP